MRLACPRTPAFHMEYTNLSVMARFRTGWPWVACAWLTFAAPSMADATLEGSVKAGFIYNFVAFTDWPEGATPNQEIRICALTGQPLAGQLALLQDRQIRARTLRVRTGTRQDEWRACQVLFVSQQDIDRLDPILRSLGNAPVLTVSDIPDFIRAGGMIGMKQSAGRVRFDINLATARRAGLVLSSRLLSLADEVLR